MKEDIWHTPPKGEKTITIDFRTSPEGETLRCGFTGAASVIFDSKAVTFRFDGLEYDPAEAQAVYDFLTHFHSDHANAGALERMYQKGLESTVMYPLPALESSQRKRAFELIRSIAETGKYQFDGQNSVYTITPAGEPLPTPAAGAAIGQFLYSRYEFEDLTVETFKYLKPLTENTDGLIYRVAHKGVSCLLFGGFDDEKALAELLACSKANEEKRKAILEELRNAETEERERELREQLALLPTLRSDVVKWPHNARIFKSRELIEQMNAVINPQYFIYQAHPAQEKDPRNPVKFKEMIQGLDFEGKFINSAEYDVEIIS